MAYYSGKPKEFKPSREASGVCRRFLRVLTLSLHQAQSGCIRVDNTVYSIQADREALIRLAPVECVVSFQAYPAENIAVVRIRSPRGDYPV